MQKIADRFVQTEIGIDLNFYIGVGEFFTDGNKTGKSKRLSSGNADAPFFAGGSKCIYYGIGIPYRLHIGMAVAAVGTAVITGAGDVPGKKVTIRGFESIHMHIRLVGL